MHAGLGYRLGLGLGLGLALARILKDLEKAKADLARTLKELEDVKEESNRHSSIESTVSRVMYL